VRRVAQGPNAIIEQIGGGGEDALGDRFTRLRKIDDAQADLGEFVPDLVGDDIGIATVTSPGFHLLSRIIFFSIISQRG
jgi:hypothetical protein